MTLGTATSNGYKSFDVRVSLPSPPSLLPHLLPHVSSPPLAPAKPPRDAGCMLQGTYMLSNLLQELALARDYGRKRIVLDEARLTENPVDRLSRMIKNSFWNSLTRRIDGDGLEIICADPKNR